MKYRVSVPCVVCDAGVATVQMYFDRGERENPPEHGAEVVAQTCQCNYTDEQYEAVLSAAVSMEAPGYDGPDTLEERD